MGFFFGSKTETGYQPATIYAWFKPEISGNEINGLGEAEPRRPTPMLWHRLKYIRYKLVQLLFQSRFRPRLLLQHQDIAKHFLRMKKLKKQLKTLDPAPTQIEKSPEEWQRLVTEFCLANDADAVRVTRLREEWIFQGYELPEWADAAMRRGELTLIMMAVQHEEECFEQAPAWDFSKEIANRYNCGSELAVKTAHWVLGQGYHAYGHGGPEAGEFLLTPAAIEAGLGELGKHGSLINPELGANFRIASVYTTMPVAIDKPEDFGIDDFCMRCQICTKACPPQAISDGKKMVRGVEKFYVDFDKCMPFMTDNYGCGKCLVVCPWNNEKVANNIMRKYHKRLAKQATEVPVSVSDPATDKTTEVANG